MGKLPGDRGAGADLPAVGHARRVHVTRSAATGCVYSRIRTRVLLGVGLAGVVLAGGGCGGEGHVCEALICDQTALTK